MIVDAVVARVRGALETNSRAYLMEEVVALCPDLSWSQIFQAIDNLSRNGQVQLSLDRKRTYRVKIVHSRRNGELSHGLG
jgi:hypothetical protein